MIRKRVNSGVLLFMLIVFFTTVLSVSITYYLITKNNILGDRTLVGKAGGNPPNNPSMPPVLQYVSPPTPNNGDWNTKNSVTINFVATSNYPLTRCFFEWNGDDYSEPPLGVNNDTCEKTFSLKDGERITFSGSASNSVGSAVLPDRTVIENNPPTDPKNGLPVGRIVSSQNKIILRWEHSSDVDHNQYTPNPCSNISYSWAIYDKYNNFIDGASTLYNYSYPVNVQDGMFYSAAVYANDGCENSDIARWEFIENTPPAEPRLISPYNNEIINRTNVNHVWTATDNDGDSLTYLFYHGEISPPPLIGKTSEESYQINNLQDLRRYYWYVVANDSYELSIMNNINNNNYFINTTIPTDTIPPIISGLNTRNIGDHNVQIVWNTNEPATSLVRYKLTDGVNWWSIATPLNPDEYVLTHLIVINNLLPNTNYTYHAESCDNKDNCAVSNNLTFMTYRDTTPPLITGLNSNPISSSQIRIFWNTSEDANSTIFYGKNNTLNMTINDNSFISLHNVLLSNLQPNTSYRYKVLSCDIAGNCANSSIREVTTFECSPSWGQIIDNCISGYMQVHYFDNNNCPGSESYTEFVSCGRSSSGSSSSSNSSTNTSSSNGGLTYNSERIFQHNIYKINVTYTSSTLNVILTPKTNIGDIPNTIIYEGYEISSSSDVIYATIYFKVSKTWVVQNNINITSIGLYRYLNNSWIKLSTTKINEDTTNLYFSAKTLSFSNFAIAGKQIYETISAGRERPYPLPTYTSNNSSINTNSYKKSSMLWFIIGIIGMLIMGAIVYFFVIKKQSYSDLSADKLEELRVFINSSRIRGLTDDQIKEKLLSVGWNEKYVKHFFEKNKKI